MGSEYPRALFLLSKGMLLLMEHKLSEVHPLLTLCGTIVENWQGNPIQKDSLRVFFLLLQVTHYLDAGQVKSVKPCLKQLQQCIQTISTLNDDEIIPTNPAALFHWLPKEHAGHLEKAQKYTDKALMQLQKLKMLDRSPILSTFQVILLEHIIMCRLVTGHKATALQEGLYCISVNCMDNAEAQFTAALQTNGKSCVYRRFLRETLKMSNAEDLNLLTAWSLVLLGHIFLVLGNHRLASKIPDISVQLWSSSLLKVCSSADLNKACGNTMDAHEAAQMHQTFSQQLLQDHMAACSLPEHNLISWTDGLPPVQLQPQNGPTTSLASLL
ncbi:unnamed protein product [Pleuronectes platessa]|uniref:Cohesin loading complex subunit SCC4 homolog n=1 Tax=Pleuronectes platessa TaxID=8262 RepID=A0A9N7VWW9_PLEPL|nr:unnamed protein product [Pleuronectes platessa]